MTCVECLKRGDYYYIDVDDEHVCLCFDCAKYKIADPKCVKCWHDRNDTCFDDGVCSEGKENAETNEKA